MIDFAKLMNLAETDPVLAIFLIRDTDEVRDAGLLKLAYSLVGGCSKGDVIGFLELLQEYMEKKENTLPTRMIKMQMVVTCSHCGNSYTYSWEPSYRIDGTLSRVIKGLEAADWQFIRDSSFRLWDVRCPNCRE